MAKTICFVTYELAPVNRGGAGVVIAALAEALGRAGHAVHVIADMPRAELEEYRRHLAVRGLGSVEAHELAALADPYPPLDSIFQAKSCAFRNAVYALARRSPLDVVEFFEYAGAAFDTLTLREPGDALGAATVAVRIHGSLGMIDHSTGLDRVSAERHAMYRMEQWSMASADVVLAPLREIGEQYGALYGIDPRRVRVCPPPMESLLAEIGGPLPRAPEPKEVLYWGKLHPVKGVETFVEGCLAIAESRPNLRFVLVGADTDEAPPEGGSMRAYLERLIPPDRRDRFQFVPFSPRRELAVRAAAALCAVVPSRSESFCLVAHELARAGCPLVLSDIPAFQYFEEARDALHFDGTPGDLAVALDRLARDPELRQRLAGAGARLHYPAVELVYDELASSLARRGGVGPFARREVASLGALAAERGEDGAEGDRRDRLILARTLRLVKAGRSLGDRVLGTAPGLKGLLGRLRR